MSNPQQIVRDGYDAVAFAHSSTYPGDGKDGRPDYLAWTERALRVLPARPAVLELGCGGGVPVAAALEGRCHYFGVDLSPVQIARAKTATTGQLVCEDVCNLRFDAESFDLVIALYTIIHVPLEQQPELLNRIGRWLRPGGVFLATLGHENWTGTEENWLEVHGATMYWSHADAETYRRWLQEAGLTIVVDELIPEGSGGHQLFQAQRVI